jgi:hypothetical protein
MQLDEYQPDPLMLGATALAFAAVLSATLAYGLLAPWWTSRTGIGFMSTKVSFTVIIGLTLLRRMGMPPEYWLAVTAWLLVAVTMFVGVTWNILDQQFFRRRSDRISPTGRRRKHNDPKGRTNGTD